ncbi:hypothetical protein CLAFUW4_14395 [Fulvia fulva]|uniref:Uncharacterized protein n=1 Tax=Passalora fulva TaxID=5499 RepID=A0A9Q8PMC0_PASFU|nr:uncharacterized protein CLAFUR5_14225 [Fulvia fulva]KAK4609402.1 hypothetical protein CLAFUR4_14391 [Fulvia fulva]KAK4609902.1 hypothetical protein CLAFUR0_14395 [Fulvia fulva]UJO25063.1 hypothetical protein CLAFUR5_14225 [Fulvia fulva]WPV22579.1 hypothetical protein CLAFUW4_14395 [Fulvia fulva]WPV37671.1 hypothetical protein CLAFUW7_14400 [Fulvia fulva]
MVRAIVTLAFGLLLASGSALAGNSCSSNQYQSLMKMTANDRSVQQYCHSMPQRHRFDRNKCPKALRAMSYDKVKEYCGCYKNTCMPTNCGYKTTCSKSPCGNYCADLQSDAKSCGSCGKQCKYGEVCKSGKCKATCPSDKPDSCPDPSKYGQLTCTNKKTDKKNCGRCGTQCKYGEDCQYGQCKPVCPADKPDQCPNPQKYGALECTNKQKDLKNCGQCGTKCKSGEECKYGQCKPICPADKPDQCPNPQKYGALECSNKQKDAKNCGQCGTKCYDQQTCKGGNCQCPEQLPLACGQKESLKCVDPTKPENCGTCGNKCTAPQICKDKSCQCPAEKPTTCGTSCCLSTEVCKETMGVKSCAPAPVVCTPNEAPCAKADDCCSKTCSLPDVVIKTGTKPGTCKPACTPADSECTTDSQCCSGNKCTLTPVFEKLQARGVLRMKTCQPELVCKAKDQTCTMDSDCVMLRPELGMQGHTIDEEGLGGYRPEDLPAKGGLQVLRPELGMQGRAIHEEKDSYRSHPDEDLSAKSGLQGEGSDMHKRWRLLLRPELGMQGRAIQEEKESSGSHSREDLPAEGDLQATN